jgi:hypothetical protein
MDLQGTAAQSQVLSVSHLGYRPSAALCASEDTLSLFLRRFPQLIRNGPYGLSAVSGGSTQWRNRTCFRVLEGGAPAARLPGRPSPLSELRV